MNAKLEKTLLCAFRLISIMKLPLQACMFVAFTLFLEKKAFFSALFWILFCQWTCDVSDWSVLMFPISSLVVLCRALKTFHPVRVTKISTITKALGKVAEK